MHAKCVKTFGEQQGEALYRILAATKGTEFARRQKAYDGCDENLSGPLAAAAAGALPRTSFSFSLL